MLGGIHCLMCFFTTFRELNQLFRSLERQLFYFLYSHIAELILQASNCFTYVTAHSPTLQSLHLRHSPFSNPSFASLTSQVFTYCTSSGKPPMTASQQIQVHCDSVYDLSIEGCNLIQGCQTFCSISFPPTETFIKD